MLIECLTCYEEFEQRADAPNLKVCCECEPDPKDMSDWLCPNCGWDSQSITCDSDAPMKVKNKYPDWEYGYCGGENWTEVWTCPECNTEFSYYNSSV